MKKQILNLGRALNKAEQKLVNGGDPGNNGGLEEQCNLIPCHTNFDCESVSLDHLCQYCNGGSPGVLGECGYSL